MPSDDHRVGVKHPGLILKYSTFKNLATMAATQDDLETAMEFYLEVKTFIISIEKPSFSQYFLNVFDKPLHCLRPSASCHDRTLRL